MPANDNPDITNAEFAQFQKLIYKIAGISLADTKKVLLVGRLGRRLRHLNLSSFTEYYRLVACGDAADELQTTNETYFFREEAHFDYLKRIYTIAFVLADTLGLA